MNVGWHWLEVFDEVQKARVPAGVLYPTRAEPRAERFEPFTLDVATDAPPDGSDSGSGSPLLLVSHGTGSSPWLMRGLAVRCVRAGFAVAMIRHPGNNRGDDAHAFTIPNLENRPRHLRLVLDAALADPLVSPCLARDRVAVIGHSLGGYTALALAGGQPAAGPNDTHDGTSRALRVEHDPRVRALVLLAPATGWYMGEGALAAVTVPIFVRTGDEDIWTPPIHGEIVERGVPDRAKVDLRVVPRAGHFSFMTPYPDDLRRPDVLPSTDPPGFDRAAYEPVLGEEIVAFLRRTLGA
jgi:predicted dienelactone hydrolase